MSKHCDGSGLTIGYAKCLSADKVIRLSDNPLYVTANTARCPKCLRIVPVKHGRLGRHNTYRLKS